MQRRLKERLIGAAVLVMLAVIFIPMLLDNSIQQDSEINRTNIPEKPDNGFSSRIFPVPESSGNTSLSNLSETAEDNAAPAEPLPATAIPVQPPVNREQSTPRAAVDNPDAGSDETGLIAWVVQIGSFTSEENARSLNEKARKLGFTSFVEPGKQGSRQIYRVRVGPELLRSEALALADKLKESMQVDGIILQYP
jgi:DedD protein